MIGYQASVDDLHFSPRRLPAAQLHLGLDDECVESSQNRLVYAFLIEGLNSKDLLCRVLFGTATTLHVDWG
jgi:hypothetical protein